jgi:hypothetical protein
MAKEARLQQAGTPPSRSPTQQQPLGSKWFRDWAQFALPCSALGVPQRSRMRDKRPRRCRPRKLAISPWAQTQQSPCLAPPTFLELIQRMASIPRVRLKPRPHGISWISRTVTSIGFIACWRPLPLADHGITPTRRLGPLPASLFVAPMPRNHSAATPNPMLCPDWTRPVPKRDTPEFYLKPLS